tara:strand:- start:1520 stop:2674 length:1155 start_codon:yes stop_codon:yes gene_type:complete
MANEYDRVIEPLALSNTMILKNRLYFAPMGIDVADKDGTASQEFIDFYLNIIAGGVGMVVLGNASIHPTTRLHEKGLCLHNETQAKALSPLFVAGKKHGCKVVVQLQHYGAQGSMSLTGKPLLSPSGIACKRMQAKEHDYQVSTMSQEDINSVKQQFVIAAGLAKQAGAELVQLQASNGYLLSSFLSPYTNQRTDKYGGSGESRFQLLLEVIQEIKASHPELGICVRLGIDDGLGEAGQRPELLSPYIRKLEASGIYALTLSVSIGETFSMLVDATEEAKIRLASGISEIRKNCTIPLGFAGLIGSLEDAVRVRNELQVDLVGMTRALFADNELINKSVSGRKSDIHFCKFDGHCFRDKSNPQAERVYCCVNPQYLRPSNINYE